MANNFRNIELVKTCFAKHVDSLIQSIDLIAGNIILVPVIETKIVLSRQLILLAETLLVVFRRLSELGVATTFEERRSILRATELFSLKPAANTRLALKKILILLAELDVRPEKLWSSPSIYVLDEPNRRVFEKIRCASNNAKEEIEAHINEISDCYLQERILQTEFPFNCRELTVSRDIRCILGAAEPVPLDATIDEIIRRGFHRHLMCTEIPTIEVCAFNILYSEETPFEFILDMSSQAWDEARHAEACLHILRKYGGDIGRFPISIDLWEMSVANPLSVRLALHQRIGETLGIFGNKWWSERYNELQLYELSEIQYRILLDEVRHVSYGNKWLRYCTQNDQFKLQRIEEIAHQIRSKYGGVTKVYPMDIELLSEAGYTKEEIELLLENKSD